MDDSCAVCAETLEWVAYGACGHRDVCSTCVARLRFICDDPRCCICKTEAAVVFVTKALGDYTMMINNFGVLPSEPKEGRVGSYWHHEDTQAFFDDADHYKMIKAMCKLSCTVCDKMDANEAPKRRGRFRSVEQLKGHLFHQHKSLMCNLCLEGRKVFICEQKLYTRAQLNQHINTGDSEVDGDESERGGFSGHPPCDFCRTPFYGENELYTHMSTEHFTCFICQRQNQGQYEYFKNYDDLEIHFRHDHFLCEDESCLAKKFIVFPSESEMKRHNTLEHGGRMSRAKRNAALQIPTSFRFRRSNEQDRRHGRGRTIRHDYVDDQITAAINASLETANTDGKITGSFPTARTIPDFADDNETDVIINQFESLTATESEKSKRYRQALGQDPMNSTLGEAAFPPLLASSSCSSSQVSKPEPSEGFRNTMADLLRRQTQNSRTRQSQNSRNPNASRAWTAPSRPSVPPTAATVVPPSAPVNPSSGPASSSCASLAKGQALGRAAAAALRVKSPTPSRNIDSNNRISHSASAPNLVGKEPATSDFPPISATRPLPAKTPVVPKVEDVQAANRVLVEKIKAALGDDEEKYTAFKEISGHYRLGSVDSEMYIDYVQHFGLSHLILDLVRLLPDPEKQRELMEAHNASMRRLKENGWGHGSSSSSKKGSNKGKHVQSNPTNALAESIIGTVRDLQSNYKPVEQDVEVLSKDGYRITKGKSKVTTEDEQQRSGSSVKEPMENQNSGGGSKKPKKTSKFHRVRLGEGSKAAILDLRNSDPDPDPDPVDDRSNGDNPCSALPLRGVWQKGGGNKLMF